ncbi:hypothetical protein ACFZAT_28640 [Streptomyces sp. NPDC008163]|uniref:hypothetical protein n=1 Tax=Streptomyces sp. NPDC008163 TaxID=3364818 RepID=UPI0036EF567D
MGEPHECPARPFGDPSAVDRFDESPLAFPVDEGHLPARFGGPLGTEKADHVRMRSLRQLRFTPGGKRGVRGRFAEADDDYQQYEQFGCEDFWS